MYNSDTQLLYLAVFLTKHDLYTKMKTIHKPNFYNPTIKKAAEFIDEYYDEYSSLPDHLLIRTKTGVDIPTLPSVDFAAEQWFVKEYPKFCLHKSLESAIFQSNEELENENYDVVEKIIQEAYEVRLGFDYGINYDEDPKGRLQNILDRSGNISSTFETIDRKLGKFNAGDLIVYIGSSGCVTYDTPVKVIKYHHNKSNIDVQPTYVPIGELMNDCENDDYHYVVDSPDGWVDVVGCYEKTKNEMYTVVMDDGHVIKASHDHLFQKPDESWWYAKDLKDGDVLITSNGVDAIQCITMYEEETKVYDLSVDHPNHRYYTNEVCSHNTGKSLFLQNHGVNYWSEGKVVLQITLELHPELVARRMDSMLLGVSTKDLYRSLDDVAAKIAMEKKKSSVKGEMRIKSMPSGSTTAEIKNLVKMFMNDTGKKVDVLIVDYLDIVNPAGKFKIGDTFNKDKLVSEELRNIGQELGPIVLTASQINRDGHGEENINHSHIAGGISKINTADLVLAIVSTAALREKGMYELQAIKVRNGQGTGLKFPLLYNTNTMKISDDPEYLSTINSSVSINTQKSNTDYKDTEVSKMVNQLQNTLNKDDPNYKPVEVDEDENDDSYEDSRLSDIRALLDQQGK